MGNGLIPALLFALLADAPKPDAPPAIPWEQQAEYYRADAIVARMQAAWDQANADRAAAIAAMQKTCGAKYQPQVDAKRLVCAPKQENAKPEPPRP